MKNGRLKQKHGIYNQPHRVQGVQSKNQFFFGENNAHPLATGPKTNMEPKHWTEWEKKILVLKSSFFKFYFNSLNF